MDVEKLMKITMNPLGKLAYSEDMLIYFSRGIIGFEHCFRFLVVEDDEYEPFRWLVAVDEIGVAFPILDPFIVAAEYAQELPEGLVSRLFASREMLDVFGVVNLNGDQEQMTINMRSPILIDYDRRTGEQLILSSDDLPFARPIF